MKPVLHPTHLIYDEFVKCGHPRMRCAYTRGKPWAFNYSLIKIENPRLNEILDDWIGAFNDAVYPAMITSMDITIHRSSKMAKDPVDLGPSMHAFCAHAQEIYNKLHAKGHLGYGDREYIRFHISTSPFEQVNVEVDDDYTWHIPQKVSDDLMKAFLDVEEVFEKWNQGECSILMSLAFAKNRMKE